MRRHRPHGRRLSALVLAVLALAACRRGSDEQRPLPPPTPVVRVVMREYRFEGPEVVQAGRVLFRVTNAGRLDHQLTLIRLPEDFTSTIDAQLRGPTRRIFPTVATLFDRHPGQSGVFATILRPGRYAMICFTSNDQGTHAVQGMSAELRSA